MGTETTKIALNAHVHLRTANQQLSPPERHMDDITDMRRSCWLRENTSGQRPLGLSPRLLTLVEIQYTLSILQVYFICTSQKKSTFEVYLVCTSRKKV